MIETLAGSAGSAPEMDALPVINLLWILPLYFVVYFIITFLFTYRVKKISEKNWKAAAMLGFTVEFIFIFTTILATTLYNIEGMSEYVVILLVAIVVALGNGLGTFSVGKHSEKKKKKLLKEKRDFIDSMSDKELISYIKNNDSRVIDLVTEKDIKK